MAADGPSAAGASYDTRRVAANGKGTAGAAAVVVVGVDTGGTFTDLVGIDAAGALVRAKVPSTPDDPSRAILEGLREIGAAPRAAVIHGTTVGTNALLERKLPRTVLVTTAGFRDVLEIARQDRSSLYDLFADREPPLVPAGRRLEANERLDAAGGVVEPLRGLASLARRVAAEAPEAIAVALLFSYANPRHERAIERALSGLGVPVSRSSDVLPEHREYERTATTVANAALRPVLARYLESLARSLRGRSLRVLQSNGGLFSARAAASYPVRTVFSGPAGGVIGAVRVGREAGLERLLTFDMGGTSTDVSLVDGEPRLTTEFAIGSVPIRVPVLDIHTVGAGGGSIARVDAGGALRVGPESAGARPGPAAYGTGDRATVTDANLFLGRIDPESFLGGRMRLHPERAARAIGRLAREAKMSPRAAALGVIDVVNANMERALKAISVQRGHDPALFALVAFGGAGGLHAAALARALSIPRVLVPRDPGLLSAKGLLMADAVRDFAATVLRRRAELAPGDLASRARPLERRARRELAREGVPPAKIRVRTSLDLRYAGQSFELAVPWDGGERDFASDFHAAHERAFGTSNPRGEIEVVAVRVRAAGPVRGARAERRAAATRRASRRAAPRPFAVREAVFAGGARRTAFHRRDDLRPFDRIAGPAVVLEMSATTLVPEGMRAAVDAHGHLVIDTREARKRR